MFRKTFYSILIMLASGLIGMFGAGLPESSEKQGGDEDEQLLLAVGGHDVMTYYEKEGPVKVKEDDAVIMEWNGKEWRFLSEENKKKFAENPVRYAPRYGGHCCQTLRKGKLEKGNPRVFRIEDGRLHLFHDKDRKRMWAEDLPLSRSQSEDHYISLFSRDF